MEISETEPRQSAHDAWNANIQEEADFWRGWLEVMMSDTEEGVFRRGRLMPRSLPGYIAGFSLRSGERLRVLDVGSGPLTTLGTKFNGIDIDLVATDPLADEYNALLDEFGVEAPVRPQKAFAESLTEMFGEGAFDVAHAGNSLDHCADPILGVIEMGRVVRPGGLVCLAHQPDVGEQNQYHGLHQWNFRREGEDLLIWSRWKRALLSEILPGYKFRVTDVLGGAKELVVAWAVKQ